MAFSPSENKGFPRPNLLRCGGPFLKESVKRKRFPPGLLRTGSARRQSRVLLTPKLRSIRVLTVVTVSGIRLDCRRYGKLRSFFSKRDCSQHIPSQGTAHEQREQLGPVMAPGRCRRIWCEFLAVRATPSTATCRWPRPSLAQTAASTVRLELTPTVGI